MLGSPVVLAKVLCSPRWQRANLWSYSVPILFSWRQRAEGQTSLPSECRQHTHSQLGEPGLIDSFQLTGETIYFATLCLSSHPRRMHDLGQLLTFFVGRIVHLKHP